VTHLVLDARKLTLLNTLTLNNAYFPPDINDLTKKNDIDNLILSPYNEYCAQHFDATLKSLSMQWNVVGQNAVRDMVPLLELHSLTLSLRLDNDHIDYGALYAFLTQSACLPRIANFVLTMDVRDAEWSSLQKFHAASRRIIAALCAPPPYRSRRNIRFNVTDLCDGVVYVELMLVLVPQMVLDLIRSMPKQYGCEWEVTLSITKPQTSSKEFNDYCQHCVEQVIQHIAAGSLVEKRYMKQNRRCSARLTFNIELNSQQMFRMRSWTGRPVMRR